MIAGAGIIGDSFELESLLRFAGKYIPNCDFIYWARSCGYYAWLTVNMQCNAYGESPDEAIRNLEESMNEIIDEMYMVEDFV